MLLEEENETKMKINTKNKIKNAIYIFLKSMQKIKKNKIKKISMKPLHLEGMILLTITVNTFILELNFKANHRLRQNKNSTFKKKRQKDLSSFRAELYHGTLEKKTL